MNLPVSKQSASSRPASSSASTSPTPNSTTFHLPFTSAPVTPAKILLILKKIVALSLIISPLIQIYVSLQDILFILPKISFVGSAQTASQLYRDLFKKALVISSSLLIDSAYGFSLLVKPGPATKLIHIILGILILIISQVIFRLAAFDQLLNHLEFFPLT